MELCFRKNAVRNLETVKMVKTMKIIVSFLVSLRLLNAPTQSVSCSVWTLQMKDSCFVGLHSPGHLQKLQEINAVSILVPLPPANTEKLRLGKY